MIRRDPAQEALALRVVGVLILISLASVFILWTLDPLSPSSQSMFAVYLAIDLVSFAMISYAYRKSKSGEDVHKMPMIAGSVLLALLLVLAAVGFLAF